MSEFTKTNWLERAKHDGVANLLFHDYIFQRDQILPQSNVTIGTCRRAATKPNKKTKKTTKRKKKKTKK